MKVKKFLVQFESDAATRWPWPERELLRLLHHGMDSIGAAATDGPRPRASVIPEETHDRP